jgi:hypothetical protein
MSAYLTSMVRRSLAPDLSIRPRLSSMFDAPAQGLGWDGPAFEQSAEAEMHADIARAGDAGGPLSTPAGPNDRADRQQQARAPLQERSILAAGDTSEPIATDTPTAATVRRHDAARIPVDTALVQQDRQEPEIEKLSGALRDPGPVRAPRSALHGSRVSREPATAHAPQADGPRETQEERRNTTPRQPIEPARRVPTRREAQLAAARRLLHADLARRLPDSPREAEDTDSTDSAEPQSVSTRFPASKSAAQNHVRRHPAMPSSPFAQRANRAHETADRSEAPKPEPTIEVTIGRIEVRAATTATPSRKPSPTTGAPSLEDFLRGRPGQGIR